MKWITVEECTDEGSDPLSFGKALNELRVAHNKTFFTSAVKEHLAMESSVNPTCGSAKYYSTSR